MSEICLPGYSVQFLVKIATQKFHLLCYAFFQTGPPIFKYVSLFSVNVFYLFSTSSTLSSSPQNREATGNTKSKLWISQNVFLPLIALWKATFWLPQFIYPLHVCVFSLILSWCFSGKKGRSSFFDICVQVLCCNYNFTLFKCINH